MTSLKDRRLRGDFIEILKVQKGLEKFEWVKSPFLIKNKEITGPASGARGNTLRLYRESFKSRLINNFSQLVTVRHSFFLNKVIHIRNSLPDDDATSLILNIFKSAFDIYYKEFG